MLIKKLLSISFIVLFLSLSIKNSFAEEVLDNINIEDVADSIKSFKLEENSEDKAESGFFDSDYKGSANFLDNFDSNGFANVKINNKSGLINKKGKFLFKPIYNYFAQYQKNKLSYFYKDDSLGFLDNNGKEIIIYNKKDGYEIGEIFKEEFLDGLVALIKKEKDLTKCGYINEKNELVIQMNFISCSSFSERKAFVEYIVEPIKKEETKKIINEDDEPDYDYNDNYIEPEKKYGFIDIKGKILFNLDFNKNEVFKVDGYENGFAIVKKNYYDYGIINKNGKYIIEPNLYTRIEPFNNGLFNVEKNGKWGYIAENGKIVIDFKFDRASKFDSFPNGKALVSVNDNMFYINNKGETIESYSCTTFDLNPKKENDKWGFTDSYGKFLIKPQFEKVTYFSYDFASIKINGKWGYIDKLGKIIIAPQFDQAYYFSNGFAVVKKDNDYHYIDTTGKIVISLSNLKKIANEGNK